MSFTSGVKVVVHDVEVAAEDALKWMEGAEKIAPQVAGALGVLAGGVEKALADVAADASNPQQLVLNLSAQVGDLKAVWPEVKAFLATLGIKV